MSEVKFQMQVRATLREGNSEVVPELIIKGHHPVIVVTFPNIAERNDDLMVVDVDATSFEQIELAAIFRAISDTMLNGILPARPVPGAPEDPAQS